jgi:hypothetical protein
MATTASDGLIGSLQDWGVDTVFGLPYMPNKPENWVYVWPRPVLVEAVVDPYEPPMPPSVPMGQASHFAESLARGEPNRKKIALTIVEDKVRELV